jgi:hypothetical protein
MCSEFLKSSGYIIQKDGKHKSIPIKFNKNCSYEIVEISEETMIIKDIQKDILPISNDKETEGYTILSDMNNEYTLIKRYDNFIVISYDIYTTLKMNIIKKFVHHSYCRTGDSIQGTTINTSITIYDWQFIFGYGHF